MTTAPTGFSTKYDGNVEIKGLKDKSEKPIFIQGFGEKLILESFKGDNVEQLQSLFGREVVKERNELKDLTEIFDAARGEKILKTYSSNTLNGVLISGYALIDKTTEKIIGYLSFEQGTEPGESKCHLEIGSTYRGQGYGREAIALMTGLCCYLKRRMISVGPDGNTDLLKKFTVSVLKDDHAANFIQKIGLEQIRTTYNYRTTREEIICGIEAKNLKQVSQGYMVSFDNISTRHELVGNSPIQGSHPPPPTSFGENK